MKGFIYIVFVFMLFSHCTEDLGSENLFVPGDGTGVAGSTSRFVIKGDYLYIATETQLKVVYLNHSGSAELVASIKIDNDLETLYSYGDYLFLGAQSGVHVYNIEDPTYPVYLSNYIHQTACDPIIANGQYAYYTIRGGTDCRGNNVNQLVTLDISHITSPKAVHTINMISPRGLAFGNGELFVGEGTSGLKKFDISQPDQPKLDTFYTSIPANDMIALGPRLIITEPTGIRQYKLNADSLNLLSKIE